MKTIQEMELALGSPSSVISLPVSADGDATISRWKHGDAEPRLTGGDGLIKIVVNLSNNQKVERLKDGFWLSKPFAIGSFAVIPPDEEVCFSVKGKADVLQVFMPRCVVCREFDAASLPTIRPRFQDQDPIIERFAFQIMVAAENRETVDDLHLSELIAGLGSVLGRDAQEKPLRIKGGLPPHRVRRVMELISGSIGAPEVKALSLEQLANAAELSPYHFARAFRETVGLSPYGFVLRKRLEGARAMLAKTSFPVADIARHVGFRSHANFSSQFRQQTGVSPLSFRRAIQA